MQSRLVLNDGTVFLGDSFASETNVSGEVVFNTGMAGYVESLTDPSYFGQILVLTYPLVGNYGVPEQKYFESAKIQVKALIVQNYIDTPSHYQSKQSLGAWLKQQHIPAIEGIDTRSLTRKLSSHGVLLGKVLFNSTKLTQYDPNRENVLPNVSIKTPQVYGTGKKNIVVIDCGAKENIIRSFIKRGARVTRVPWDFNPLKQKLEFNGVLISNGPGDPQMAKQTIQTIQDLLKQNIPTFGICLGSQLLALASGGKTYKLKFGHRGQNQPVQDVFSKKALITSQNHGFAVDSKSLGSDWVTWFLNLNDGTNEGVRHKKKPFMSVQFHPEATPGPVDAGYLFDEFLSLV